MKNRSERLLLKKSDLQKAHFEGLLQARMTKTQTLWKQNWFLSFLHKPLQNAVSSNCFQVFWLKAVWRNCILYTRYFEIVCLCWYTLCSFGFHSRNCIPQINANHGGFGWGMSPLLSLTSGTGGMSISLKTLIYPKIKQKQLVLNCTHFLDKNCLTCCHN